MKDEMETAPNTHPEDGGPKEIIFQRGGMSDSDLYEILWQQIAEVDDGETTETLLSIPDGVSEEQFQRVLRQIKQEHGIPHEAKCKENPNDPLQSHSPSQDHSEPRHLGERHLSLREREV